VILVAFFLYKNISNYFQYFSTPVNISKVSNSIDVKNNLYSQLLKEYPRLYDKNINSKKNTVLESKKYKYMATDGYVITHRYDENLDKLVPLEQNELLDVTPKQRIMNQLHMLYEAKVELTVNTKNVGVTNPFRIDKNDIAAYQKNKTKVDYKSFKVIKDSKNNPILIFTTYGTPEKEINTVLKEIKKAISLLEKNDPGMLPILIRDYSLRILSGNINPEKMLPQYESLIIYKVGAITFNIHNTGDDSLSYLFNIVNLSRYMGNKRLYKVESNNKTVYYMKDRLNEDLVIDRKLWTIKWLDLHKSDLFKDDYQDYIDLVDRMR
jgi:hypothetical protein